MIRIAILLAVLIFGGTAGEIAITYGMKKAGEPERLNLPELLAFFRRALRTSWFWVGLPLVAMSFYSLMVLLSWKPVSFVIPVSALSYAVGAFGGKYLLGEEVSPARWVGIVLVCTGVALVATA